MAEPLDLGELHAEVAGNGLIESESDRITPMESQRPDDVRPIANKDLRLEDLPGPDADLSALCRFAATFSTPGDGQDDELALTELRSRLWGLWRNLYCSLHESLDDYSSKMLACVEQIRRVLDERNNAHPACRCAREFFTKHHPAEAAPCWTVPHPNSDGSYAVDVFWLVLSIPGEIILSKTYRVSSNCRHVEEVD